jgi:uncharacterized membrane protein
VVFGDRLRPARRVYFAFSAFIMTSFGRIDQIAGMSVMNAINGVILRSLFMPLFLGTTLACAALVVLAIVRWQEAGFDRDDLRRHHLRCRHVRPHHGVQRAAQRPACGHRPVSSAAAPIWARFPVDWTFWNHVRTVASTAATALLILAIAQR